MDYVALAKVSGASTWRILFIHIFPGTINTLIVVATLQVGIVILLESTLSFLGAGVPSVSRLCESSCRTSGEETRVVVLDSHSVLACYPDTNLETKCLRFVAHQSYRRL